MRNYFHILVLMVMCSPLFSQSYFTIKDRQMYDQYGQKFFVKGVNYQTVLYVPDTVGTSGMCVSRPKDYYSTGTYTCTGSTSCLNDIAYDFNYISNALGCNTIRLWAGNISLNHDTCSIATDFRVDVGDPSNGFHSFNPSLDLGFIVPYYKQLVDLADDYGLNVILVLPAAGGSCTDSSAINLAYYDLLDSVANGLKTCTNLIAYDEWNEPEYFGADKNDFTKQEVCAMTHTWYTHLKTHDPNHLITVGLGEGGYNLDVTEWAADDYKADFYAFHVYPGLNEITHQQPGVGLVLDKNLDYGNITAYNDRYNATITWLQNTTSLPWMIGETGFRANPNPDTSSNYFDDGTLSQQSTYLTNAYTQVLKAGGMGTLWWQYSDVHWSVPGFPTADPSVNYFGLVDRLNGNIKPAGTTLRNFNSASVNGPPAGYPGNYQNYLGNTGAVISGSVKDAATNQPIKDAVVYGWHLQPGLTPNSTDYLYFTETITDANGNFNLTSITPDASSGFPNPATTIINIIFASAIGYDVASHDGYTQGTTPCSGKTLTLNKEANYDIQPGSAHYLATTNDALVSAPNTLTLSDFRVYFSGGGTVYEHDYTAQKEIAIVPTGTVDSYVENTAEAGFYISQVDFNCSDLSDLQVNPESRTMHDQSPLFSSETSENTASIIKTIYMDAENTSLKIYPNPAHDKVLVESGKSLNFVYIANMYGQQVAEFNAQGESKQEIDISNWAPGVYLFKITYSNGHISYTQLIKQ